MSADPRILPAIDQVAGALLGASPALAATLAREAVAGLRADLIAGREAPADRPAALAAAIGRARAALAVLAASAPRPVVNATGTVLHTGLGRAPLSPRARAAVTAVLDGYSAVEFDLASGERGDRQALVEPLLTRLTGAEAALVVNNCAGATVLALQALAQGREVIVSRGELVEIGGSFRVPEIMTAAGCRLVEVGATNRTRIADYRAALGAGSALLLKVHKSNFVQEGFVEEVATAELVALGREHGLPVLVDQGSGCVADLAPLGLSCARVGDELIAGADLVCASGDKLLGGPQAGIILGRRDLIAQLKRHPLARALRVDKLTLAALVGTLQDWLLGDPFAQVPTLVALAEPLTAVRARGEALLTRLADVAGIALVEGRSAVGSGALPTQGPPTWLLALPGGGARLAQALRMSDPPVVPRSQHGAVVLDLRTVRADQLDAVASAVRGALGSAGG